MYDAICLASGGLDSMVCLYLLREKNISALPMYVNYGQRSHKREWEALYSACVIGGFPEPIVFDIPGFGSVIKSGLTDAAYRVNEDAFTPNRNLLFLTLASSLASLKGSRNVVIGFLSEQTTIFSDQTDLFLRSAENTLSESLGMQIHIHCPLRDLIKADVVKLAQVRGIERFYSCHLGTDEPCGQCIACLEYT
jgi:7-cyano-7-deazaguanine synthase